MNEQSRTVIARYLHDMHSLISHGHQAINLHEAWRTPSGASA